MACWWQWSWYSQIKKVKLCLINKLWLETAIASTIVRHLYDLARPLTKFDSPTFVSKLEEGWEPGSTKRWPSARKGKPGVGETEIYRTGMKLFVLWEQLLLQTKKNLQLRFWVVTFQGGSADSPNILLSRRFMHSQLLGDQNYHHRHYYNHHH